MFYILILFFVFVSFGRRNDFGRSLARFRKEEKTLKAEIDPIKKQMRARLQLSVRFVLNLFFLQPFVCPFKSK